MILIVALDGTNVLREKNSVKPLRYALGEIVKEEDQVVVLVIFNTGDMAPSPVISSCCIGKDDRNHRRPSERERYIRILREEISQGTEGYMKIFTPFYKECKNIRVKFMVKIVVGSTIDAIISEETNNIGATSVVIGRSFATENSHHVTVNACKLSCLNDDGDVALCTFKPPTDHNPESSRLQKPVYLTRKISGVEKHPLSSDDEQKLFYWTLPNFDGIYQLSSSIETSNESSHETECFSNFKVDPTTEVDGLVELSWEVISEITDRFTNIIQYVDSKEAFEMYSGYLGDRRPAVFVKRYVSTESRYVLEAEKKAASTMYHKNILGLLGFHKNETSMALVFPYNFRGALMDRFLNGFWTKELKIKFPKKMSIAIGIAQGLRYMHEQCPQGTIVHGDLRPCNILLGNNLQPQITGFGKAKWFQFEQLSPTRNSCGHKHPSDPNLLALIKSDILAFGILLLRLFCSRSAPRDDNSFVTWARPLLEQRAYHILYDESDYDIHGLLMVTSTAARCISTRLKARPCMSKVLSFLKGEISCAEQTFPSTDTSPSTPLSQDLNHLEL